MKIAPFNPCRLISSFRFIERKWNEEMKHRSSNQKYLIEYLKVPNWVSKSFQLWYNFRGSEVTNYLSICGIYENNQNINNMLINLKLLFLAVRFIFWYARRRNTDRRWICFQFNPRTAGIIQFIQFFKYLFTILCTLQSFLFTHVACLFV